MKNKEIREILMNNEVVFTVKGITEYGVIEKSMAFNNEGVPVGKKWGKVQKKLRTKSYEGGVKSIWEEDGWHGMNINKFGPTCVTLYTYDILGKKSVGKIKYEDITIIEE